MKHWGSALSFFKRGGRRRRSSYAHPGMRYELVNRRVRSERNDLSGNRQVDTPLYHMEGLVTKLMKMMRKLQHVEDILRINWLDI
ncbi:uncharacterized protein TNIN_3231 [Trichonephila inaurata madagascariensis]|uniref:Uncharacterized protein n=1 Tax=Trichonephila inaurata madagascariensis TaxID=2747483 RepID=A0A8X6XNQ2_9ARAC|nr:uncharacterized protein TNIN_3231 [Trichonephila inaurata madagascariensis]